MGGQPGSDCRSPHLCSRDPYVSTQEMSALLTLAALTCWFSVGEKSLAPLATSPQPLFVSSLFVHLLGIYLLNIFLDVFWIVGLELIRSLPDCQTHRVSPGLGITGMMGLCSSCDVGLSFSFVSHSCLFSSHLSASALLLLPVCLSLVAAILLH